MSTSLEIERKFDIPDDFRLPPLDKIGDLGEANEFDLDATYYDTDDYRLTGNRVALRRRVGGYDAGWHLKRPAGQDRSEMQLPDAAEMPDELLDQVRAIVRGSRLTPIVHLHTRRFEVPLERGGDRVLIALDTVDAERIGGDKKQWRELEIEITAGSRALLNRLADIVIKAGATPSASASKLSRALGDRVAPPEQHRAGKAAEALAGYLRKQRDDLIANDPLVRAADAEGVHDMRVAVRRLRSTLSTFRSADSEHLRGELKWLSDMIGAVRDTDVLADELISDIADTTPDVVPSKVTRWIRRRLQRDTVAARRALHKALNSKRYFALLDDVDRVADGEPVEVTSTWLYKRTRTRLAKADAQLEAAMASGVDVELHEARKSYKKARYAVELSGGEDGQGLVKSLKSLQEVLGEHQDAVVAAALLKDIADEAAAQGQPEFGIGVLYAHQQERAARRRDDVPAVYAESRKKSIRSWLYRR